MTEIYDLASSAAASTARASRAMPRGAAPGCCCSRRATSRAAPRRASTKLIHGGLRYLEHYEFGLVREALGEREALWRIAPHIDPAAALRAAACARACARRWLLRLGLFLYDHIGGRKRAARDRQLDLARHPAGAPLKPGFGKASSTRTAGSTMPGWSC